METKGKTGDAKTLVRVNRYGGFHAPAMAQTAEVTDADLTDAETEELQAMLESLEPGSGSDPDRIPDAFVYEIEIERDGESRKLAVGETAMTDTQRALVRWMEARGKTRAK